jgi:hypothetical protein
MAGITLLTLGALHVYNNVSLSSSVIEKCFGKKGCREDKSTHFIKVFYLPTDEQ